MAGDEQQAKEIITDVIVDRGIKVGSRGLLLCLSEGKVIWSKNLLKDFGAPKPSWGFANSPLVLGDRLLLDAGGRGTSAVALNKLTGDVIWKAGHDPAAAPNVPVEDWLNGESRWRVRLD